MDYTIRNIEETDLDKLVILCKKHANFEKADYITIGKKERLQKAIFSEPQLLYCIVVEVAGEIVGFASYTFDYSTWDAALFIYMDCLYLEDEYRSFGIGDALMKEVINTGKRNGCINMQWQTPEFNTRAIKFYKRMGGVGKDKLRFTLPL